MRVLRDGIPSFFHYSLVFPGLRDLLHQPLATILQQVKHQLKALTSLIIWIGHIAPLRMVATKLHKPIYLLQIFSLRCQTRHILIIAIIHHYDTIKIIVIILPETSCAMRQIIPTSLRRTSHSTVGQISCVAAIRSRRVKLKLLLKARPLNHRTHHSFRRRRATYISQTYKQYLLFHTLFHIITKFISRSGLHLGLHHAIQSSQRYQFNSTFPTPP